MAADDYFPAACNLRNMRHLMERLSIARQNSRRLPSSAAASALRFAPGADPFRLWAFVAMKAARVAVQPTESFQ
jgi:hypothetical protein